MQNLSFEWSGIYHLRHMDQKERNWAHQIPVIWGSGIRHWVWFILWWWLRWEAMTGIFSWTTRWTKQKEEVRGQRGWVGGDDAGRSRDERPRLSRDAQQRWFPFLEARLCFPSVPGSVRFWQILWSNFLIITFRWVSVPYNKKLLTKQA